MFEESSYLLQSRFDLDPPALKRQTDEGAINSDKKSNVFEYYSTNLPGEKSNRSSKLTVLIIPRVPHSTQYTFT